MYTTCEKGSANKTWIEKYFFKTDGTDTCIGGIKSFVYLNKRWIWEILEAGVPF